MGKGGQCTREYHGQGPQNSESPDGLKNSEGPSGVNIRCSHWGVPREIDLSQMMKGLECHTQKFGLYPAFSSRFGHKGVGATMKFT